MTPIVIPGTPLRGSHLRVVVSIAVITPAGTTSSDVTIVPAAEGSIAVDIEKAVLRETRAMFRACSELLAPGIRWDKKPSDVSI